MHGLDKGEKMRRDLFLACLALCPSGALTVYSRSSNAQAPVQAPETSPAQKLDETPNKKSGDVPLSKKLGENEGVLKPPHGVDPGMHQQPPANTGDKMPVIIPPGEPGGDQSVQPK
jgi:hypothetical protein